MRMRNLIFLLAVLGLMACEAGEGNYQMEEQQKAVVPIPVQDQALTNSEEKIEQKRMLIKNGSLSFHTKELEETYERIRSLVHQHEGYISEEKQYRYTHRAGWQLQLRVPAAHFDDLMAMIDAVVEDYDERVIRMEDVTEEYLDLEIRLKNKQALAARYRTLLTRAGNIREIMEVEQKLNAVATDIDRMEGRMRYLQNQISFSTLRIDMYETHKAPITPKDSFWSEAGDNIHLGWKMLQNLFLGFLAIWPIVLMLIGLGFGYRYYVRRKKRAATK